MIHKPHNKKILVIAAHPDDETLGCGGSIARFVKEGAIVYCLILNQGKASRFDDPKDAEIIPLQKQVRTEARKAMNILMVSEIIFKNFPDQRYDTVPFIDIVKSIEKVIGKIDPDIIFTHSKKDLNKDHRITFQATMTALRPINGKKTNNLKSSLLHISQKIELVENYLEQYNQANKENKDIKDAIIKVINEVIELVEITKKLTKENFGVK